VNEFDMPVHTNGAEDTAGDRIEEGFGQFAVMPVGNARRIDRIGLGPYFGLCDPVVQEVVDVDFGPIDDAVV
jgi:hypothetical protein